MYTAIKFLDTGKIEIVLKASIEYRKHSLGANKLYNNRKVMILGTKTELQNELREIESMRKELNKPNYKSIKFNRTVTAIKLF